MATDTATGLQGEWRHDEPMSLHTSWRVGGPAGRFYLPRDLDDCVHFMQDLPVDEPLFYLGLGSNLLVRDGGIPGTVLCTCNRLKRTALLPEQRLYVEAGTPCAHVARQAAAHDLTGAEFLAGIPGTMGGALAMNAGAFGGVTWPVVARVLVLDRSGAHWYPASDFETGYRSVRLAPGALFLACELQLAPGDGAASRARIRELLARRAATQPTQQPSCGSVFRNPPGDHAARLIEAAGLKGLVRGRAQVSAMHANFIVNLGGATASDIEWLILHVQAQVQAQYGMLLQPEVRIVGTSLDLDEDSSR